MSKKLELIKAARFRNEKYYRKLSKKERRQFRLNCDADRDNTFIEAMNYDFSKFSDFIAGGFYWDKTPEGNSYWSKISNRFN